MDSPYLSSSSSSASRTRVDSTFSINLTDSGGVQKRSISRPQRPRSISAATIERHPEFLPDQIQDRLRLGSVSLSSDHWHSLKYSPRPQLLEASFNPSASTSHQSPQPSTAPSKLGSIPVRKDSAKGSSISYPPATSSDMASLGYLPAPHYGNMAFQDPSFDSSYQQLDTHSHIPSSSNFNFLFGSSASSSQPIYSTGPLHMESTYSVAPLEPSLSHVSEPTFNPLNRTGSPFNHSNYDSLEFSLGSASNQAPASRSISHSPLSTQRIGPLTPPLNPGLESAQPQPAGSPPSHSSLDRMRSPSLYDARAYSSSSYTTAPVQAPLYSAPPNYNYSSAPCVSARRQVPRTSTDPQVRVLNQKPKPQCWDHGCNGREFSTFSNLLRHQREKSGTAAKSYCPKCGAEFTRTTARNGHLAHEKCSKPRRPSDIK